MKIKDIYQRLGIIPDLVEHMLTVTKVVLFIKRHWRGPEIDWKRLVKTALLHDVGNIVKFDFDKYPQFLGKEQKRILHWKKTQAQTIAKYGTDDHEATKKMLKELKLDQEMIKVILEKSFGNSVQVAKGNNWYAKILHYADGRVMPHGVVTLEERFQDVRERRPKYTNRPDFEDLLTASREIESQIQAQLDMPISAINKKTIGAIKKDFLEVKV
ncbi:HD domain-containing protein [Patescibacteria group bacterium]